MISARYSCEKTYMNFSLLQSCLQEDTTEKDSPSNLGLPISPVLWALQKF